VDGRSANIGLGVSKKICAKTKESNLSILLDGDLIYMIDGTAAVATGWKPKTVIPTAVPTTPSIDLPHPTLTGSGSVSHFKLNSRLPTHIQAYLLETTPHSRTSISARNP